MKSRFAYLGPVIAGSMLTALLVFWALSERDRARRQARIGLEQATTAVSGALVGAVQSEVSRGNMRSDRLRAILEGIVDSTDVTSIRVSQKGKPLAMAGVADLPETKQENGSLLRGATFYFWRSVELRRHTHGGRGMGRGHGGRRDLDQPEIFTSDSPQQIMFGMKANSYAAQVAAADRRIGFICLAGILAVFGLMSIWIMSIRGQSLKEKLHLASAREEQFSEFELAAYGLAHEAKHPLGIIRAAAQQIAEVETVPEQEREKAWQIMQDADVAVARLGDFMSYAKIREPQRAEIPLRDIVEKHTGLLLPDFEAADVALQAGVPDVRIRADQDMFVRLLLNLLTNALAATGPGDSVQVLAESDSSVLTLIVRDTGAGIPESIREDILKPYVTGREDGHGIGLAIVKRICDAHSWTIDIQSAPGEGTTFAIAGIEIQN